MAVDEDGGFVGNVRDEHGGEAFVVVAGGEFERGELADEGPVGGGADDEGTVDGVVVEGGVGTDEGGGTCGAETGYALAGASGEGFELGVGGLETFSAAPAGLEGGTLHDGFGE